MDGEEMKVVEESVTAENPAPVAEKSKEAETSAEIARVSRDKDAEIERLKTEIETLKRHMAEERGRVLLNEAKMAGKLTPAMTGEGSVWVEMAFNHPDLFQRAVDTLPRQIVREQRIEVADAAPSASKASALARRIMDEEGLDFADALDQVYARKLLED